MPHLSGKYCDGFDAQEEKQIKSNLQTPIELLKYSHLAEILKKYVRNSDVFLISGSNHSAVNVSESLHDEVGCKGIVHLSPPDLNMKPVKKKNYKKGRKICFENCLLSDVSISNQQYSMTRLKSVVEPSGGN